METPPGSRLFPSFNGLLGKAASFVQFVSNCSKHSLLQEGKSPFMTSKQQQNSIEPGTGTQGSKRKKKKKKGKEGEAKSNTPNGNPSSGSSRARSDHSSDGAGRKDGSDPAAFSPDSRQNAAQDSSEGSEETKRKSSSSQGGKTQEASSSTQHTETSRVPENPAQADKAKELSILDPEPKPSSTSNQACSPSSHFQKTPSCRTFDLAFKL